MAPSDALPTIAEIAITLAGFAGLIAVFRPTATRTWSQPELLRIRGLMVTCTLVLLCSLLPFGLSGIQETEGVTWGVPLVLYSVTSLGLLAHTLYQVHRHELEILTPALTWPVFAVSGTINSLLLLSGLEIALTRSAGALVLGLVWGLVTAVVTLFATVVLWIRTPPAA